MADPVCYANPDRDREQALIALKKGAQLIKYSRKGKPKLSLFRISSDENTLIWYSHKKESTIKLASVTRIIPGQRTAVFRRFLRPEKDYLSFSLLYNNGERSLDLVSHKCCSIFFFLRSFSFEKLVYGDLIPRKFQY